MKIHIILLSILFLLLNSCGTGEDSGYDNADIKIINNTDQNITVYYAEEEFFGYDIKKNDEDVEVIQKKIGIAPAENATIEVQLHIWDGEFSVVYNGIVSTYDVVSNEKLFEIVKEDFLDPTSDGQADSQW